MRDIILIALVLPCAIAAIRRPFIGIACFACLGFLNPQDMTWGIGRTLPLSQIVAIGTLTGFAFSAERKRIAISREIVLLLALWAMFAISSFLAIYPDKAIPKLMYMSKVILMTFLASAIINTESRLLWLVRVIALSLGYYAIDGGITAIKSGYSEQVTGPELSWLSSNNSIGLALSINIPILYYLAKIDKNKLVRGLSVVMCILCIPAILGTFSRGAYLGMGAATFMIMARHKRKELSVLAFFLLAAVLVVAHGRILPDTVGDRVGELVEYETESSAESRFWNWEYCWRVGNARPFTGGGFEFQSIENYERYYPEFLARWPGKVWNCHSSFFTIFSEHGYPGFFIWISLLVLTIATPWKIGRYCKEHPEASRLMDYAYLVEGALIAFMVSGFFLDACYYEILYYLIAMGIILNNFINQYNKLQPLREEIES